MKQAFSFSFGKFSRIRRIKQIDFIDCTMFGARAESLARYLSKGAKVSIEDKLRWSQWERDGQKRSKIEVIIDDIEFMTQRNQSHGTTQQYGAQQYAPQAPQYAQQPAQGYPSNRRCTIPTFRSNGR